MPTVYLPTACLVAASLLAHAQQKPTLKYTVDSVAIYTVAEDAMEQGREIWLQQGFVSQFQAKPDGELRISLLRQHNSYLNGDAANRKAQASRKAWALGITYYIKRSLRTLTATHRYGPADG